MNILRKRYVEYTATLYRAGNVPVEGWWCPDWTMWEVYGRPEQVYPDRWVLADGDPAEWLAERVERRLGYIDGLHILPGNGGEWSLLVAHAADEFRHAELSVSVRPTAHASGFSSDETAAAAAILRKRGMVGGA